MSGIFKSLAFHRNGKPRQWLTFVLFQDGMVARPAFRRLVHKKSGHVRPQFHFWVNLARNADNEAQEPSQSADFQQPHLCQEELVLQALKPFEEIVKHWRVKSRPPSLHAEKDLADIFPVNSAEVVRKLAVSIGHDDYTKVPGGVQLCIQQEQKIANERGYDYLQIHPWQPLPRLAHVEEEPDTVVALILNGNAVGHSRMSALINLVRSRAASSADVEIIVHQLLGHLPEQVTELVQATASRKCIFWLHDFFSLCPSFTLQRNNLGFCGAPPVKSNACTLCVYGQERKNHAARMNAMFEAVDIVIASPSNATADFWRDRSGLPYKTLDTLPHMHLQTEQRPNRLAVDNHSVITVAYLGSPSIHKGWPHFVDLMHEHGSSGNFRFVVMSAKRPNLGEHDWAPVQVTADIINAMSTAVEKMNVDIFLHWPTWPETFSFTTFEAFAGSAFVITHAGSGNVARAVAETGRGIVLSGKDDLVAFFRDGRAQDLAKQRRELRSVVQIQHSHSEMSFALIGKD